MVKDVVNALAILNTTLLALLKRLKKFMVIYMTIH